MHNSSLIAGTFEQILLYKDKTVKQLIYKKKGVCYLLNEVPFFVFGYQDCQHPTIFTLMIYS